MLEAWQFIPNTMANDPKDLIDAIERHLQTIEAPDFDPEANPEVYALNNVLYESGFVPHFEWSDWSKEFWTFVENPRLIESADLPTVGKLLYASLRADRFVGGHLEDMIRRGHTARVLRRLLKLLPSD